MSIAKGWEKMKKYKYLSKRVIISIIILCMAVSMLYGCTNVEKTNNEVVKDATKKDTLTVAIGAEPSSLSTVDNDGFESIYINLLVSNLLFRINMDTLLVEPDLVETYESISDTEWIFNLHEGVMFHHGKELTAEDVVASIENAKTYPGSAPYTQNIEKLEVLDKYKVKLTTIAPYSNLLYDLAYHFNYILPKDLIESNWDFVSQPIGTGPYKFKDWDRGVSITLEKNEEYWNTEEMPSIPYIVWKFIPEGTSRTLALETGEVDVVFALETADVERIKSDPKFHLEEKNSMEHFWMPLHTGYEPTNDPNFRLAIHCAIDRQAIIEGALNGYGTPSYSTIPLGYAGSWEGNSKPYDLELAKKYLDAWGGDPSKVTIKMLARRDEHVRMCTIIQGNLQKLGINVDIESVDTATWQAARSAGDNISGVTSWSPSNGFTYLVRYHSSKAESAPGALEDEQVDKLIEEMKIELDDDARLEIMHEIVERVNDLVPHVPLYQGKYFRAWDADLEGIIISGTGYMQLHTARWK